MHSDRRSVVSRFVTGRYEDTSHYGIGSDFRTKNAMAADGTEQRLQVWEHTTPRRFGALPRALFRGTDAILSVYDVTDAKSFAEATRYAQLACNGCSAAVLDAGGAEGCPPVFLVGNTVRAQCLRCVDGSAGATLCDTRGWRYVECSSRSGAGVTELFDEIASAIVAWRGVPDPPPVAAPLLASATTKRWCVVS
jgi:GTPase SAR1 family protein